MQLVPALAACMADLTCQTSNPSRQQPGPSVEPMLPDVAEASWEVLQGAAGLLCTLLAGHAGACSQVPPCACLGGACSVVGLWSQRLYGVPMGRLDVCSGS